MAAQKIEIPSSGQVELDSLDRAQSSVSVN